MLKDLISISDLSAKDIETILALAEKIKKNPVKYADFLKGKVFGLIFEKPSTRTWISFETGIISLGGNAIYLGPEDIQLGRREETRDVARVLDRYLAGVVLRTFSHNTITEFQKYFRGPVINGLSDFEHPCQALADFLTIREIYGPKKRPVVVYVGDGNNVLASLLLLAAKMGFEIRYATPEMYAPSDRVLDAARSIARKSGGKVIGFTDPISAVRQADVVYTDVWVSMGEEKIRKEKMKAFGKYQVNRELLAYARKDALVMHCLPAHRGEEITDQVMESKNSIVFDQAENRLHVQKAVLAHLMGKGR